MLWDVLFSRWRRNIQRLFGLNFGMGEFHSMNAGRCRDSETPSQQCDFLASRNRPGFLLHWRSLFPRR